MQLVLLIAEPSKSYTTWYVAIGIFFLTLVCFYYVYASIKKLMQATAEEEEKDNLFLRQKGYNTDKIQEVDGETLDSLVKGLEEEFAYLGTQQTIFNFQNPDYKKIATLKNQFEALYKHYPYMNAPARAYRLFLLISLKLEDIIIASDSQTSAKVVPT